MGQPVRVLDASIAVEWFAPSGAPQDAKATAVLAEVQTDPDIFVFPAILLHEPLAVLCRKLKSAANVSEALDDLWKRGVPVAPFDPTIAREAARLAMQHGLTGYDASYAATAQAVNGLWLTFDSRAHARIAPLGLSRVL